MCRSPTTMVGYRYWSWDGEAFSGVRIWVEWRGEVVASGLRPSRDHDRRYLEVLRVVPMVCGWLCFSSGILLG